jgi:putative membrane protein
MGLLIHFLVNALALAFVAKVFPGPPGITSGGMTSILAIALVFGFVNALIRPVLKLLSCPMIILTLGHFSLVINALMLMLTARLGLLFGIDFAVHGFWPAFLGAIVIAIISTVVGGILHAMSQKTA